jgi:cobyrinic acid a,c-diamide synthase
MDKAFNFYYQDSLDLLEAWGAEVVPFSPLADDVLPEGVGGVYLGGGFPEIYAAELANNKGMLDSIRTAGNAKMPIYAECGGLMYLGTSLTDFDGNRHEMVGVLPVESSMEKSRLTLGYREVQALVDGPLLSQGQRIRGHEFHWSVSTIEHDSSTAAYEVVNQDGRLEGIRQGNVWASYIHLHLASAPGTAQRWVETCVNVMQSQV